MKLIFIMALMSVATTNVAATPFAGADLVSGKALIEKQCVRCHASSYGGDGSEIYTRPFHKVENSSQLIAQVRTCTTNLGIQWFEEEELNAAAYLNAHYYHFKE